MIQQRTILKICDNSGAKTVRCIKVLGGFKKQYAKLGDIIIVSIQNLRNVSKKKIKLKKGEVYKALIVKTKLNCTKKDGTNFRFNENSAILLNKQGSSLGTRITSTLPKSLKKKKFQKLISISAGIIP